MTRKLRVLQIITSLSTGGAETMLRNVVARLDRGRVDTMVVSLTTGVTIGEQIEALGIPVLALNGRNGLLMPRQIARLLKATRSWRPEMIHAWMYHSNLVAHGLAFAMRRQRPAVVTSVRGAMNAPEQQKRLLRIVRGLDARLSSRADAIVFNSAESARQHVAIGYDSRNISIIPNGFDPVRFAPSDWNRQSVRSELGCGDAMLIGLVARFNPLKAQKLFLEAAKGVAERHPNCKFLLVGRGCDSTNRVLVDCIKRLSLWDRVLLLGERSDIATIDCALDVIVSSSISESFPNAIGEAMACGVPPVVTDVGDCSELVGDSGVVVPTGNSVALAAGILSLLDRSAEARQEIGRRARDRIVERFGLPAIADRYAALYSAVMARHSRVQ